VGERVGGQRLQASHESALELELERMVVPGTRGQVDTGEIRVQVGQLGDAEQIAADRADVSNRQALAASERLLECDVPLIAARKSQNADRLPEGRLPPAN
jgi:hypothetical protein